MKNKTRGFLEDLSVKIVVWLIKIFDILLYPVMLGLAFSIMDFKFSTGFGLAFAIDVITNIIKGAIKK